MKKMIRYCVITICLCGILTSCTRRDYTDYTEEENMERIDNIEEQNNEEMDYRSLDDREYLIKMYGFTLEELEGMDIEWLNQKAHFRDSGMSVERVREWVDADKPYASDTYKDTYLFLTAQPNIDIPQGTKVKKIGFYYNPGTFVQRSVFDIENKVFYVDDDIEHQLDEDLSAVVDEYNIYDWNTENLSRKLGSTGSYGWKLVFVAEDEHKYVYEGFTQDGSAIPDGYTELSNKLIDIIKSR